MVIGLEYVNKINRRFFRITKSSFLGNLNIDRRPVFDLNTKITLTNNDLQCIGLLLKCIIRIINYPNTNEGSQIDERRI